MSAAILTYFDFPGGRGEASRLAFHIANADWVDNRFSGAWPDKKPTTPFGALPTLEIPGKGVIAQSNAILCYIGHEYGLLPTDSWEMARQLALMCAVEDLREQAGKTDRPDEDAKRKAREEFAGGYLKRWCTTVSAQIKGPFVGGDTLSVADLKLFVAMRSYQNDVYDYIPKTVLDAFPTITGLMKAVAAHPRVVDWYAKK